MASLVFESIAVNGVATRLRRSDAGNRPCVVFLHGGSPGVTPFCSGAHIWDKVLAAFAAERGVLAFDLPGSGGTELPGDERPSVDAMGEHVLALLERLKVADCHLVGHDEGGLLALWLAANSTLNVRSISVVASKNAPPSGDGLPVVALANPPLPRWSAGSQAWALEQLSYSFAHVDDVFLAACVAASEASPHRKVVAAIERDDAFRSAFAQSVAKVRTQLFKTYREEGMRAPVQLVWGSNDPLVGVDRGFALFQLVAKRQPLARFDVVNRSGNFPFREEPRAFVDLVASFQEAVERAAVR